MPPTRPTLPDPLRQVGKLARDVGDLLLPRECASCGTAGTPWCADCDSELRRRLFDGGPRLVLPDPCPPGLPPVWASGPYEGPLRAAIIAYKDADRRDLVNVLAPILARSLYAVIRSGSPDLAAACRAGRPIVLVPASSSRAGRSRRGDAPMETLARVALERRRGAAGLAGEVNRAPVVCPALRVVRRVEDQAGLRHDERARNLDGALGVLPRAAQLLRGRTCIVVDDVATTGATLTEASRALAVAGAPPPVCITMATTLRRN